ncbi:UNVERIFIED_ORG: hypothetical protein GGE64_002143 [Rhizobium etli]
MDDLDAVLARLDRAVHDDLPALESHRAFAWPEIAGDHLDQRAFSGAVIAHQADDLAGFERKRHVVDRLDGAEMFRDIGEFENRCQPTILPASCRLAITAVARLAPAIPLLPISSRQSDYVHLRKCLESRQSIVRVNGPPLQKSTSPRKY